MMYRYWLSRNLYSKTCIALTREFDPCELFMMPEAQLKAIAKEKDYLRDRDVCRLLDSRRHYEAEKEWLLLMQKQILFVTYGEKNYPQKLLHITDPPYALYVRGRLPDPSQLQIAIVGARGRSAYGQTIAVELSKELAFRGVGIISGLAIGVDTDSHKGALEAGGNTYAVLGCGADVVYPRQNAYLYPKVIEAGGIISEQPPGTPAVARYFPLRNRIIAGLCDKLIVIEARLRSGSLITADFAMEFGKDVYALPGRITDELSQGTNRLIYQGAEAITSTADFLESLKLDWQGEGIQLDFRKNLLEKEEAMVYSLVDFDPISLGTLMEKTSMDLGRLLSLLDSLKDQGFIRECAINHFVRTR